METFEIGEKNRRSQAQCWYPARTRIFSSELLVETFEIAKKNRRSQAQCWYPAKTFSSNLIWFLWKHLRWCEKNRSSQAQWCWYPAKTLSMRVFWLIPHLRQAFFCGKIWDWQRDGGRKSEHLMPSWPPAQLFPQLGCFQFWCIHCVTLCNTM